MKRKSLLFIIVSILYSTIVLCQQKIDKATFEKLVDYANSQYVQAFIDNNDIGKDYYEDTYLKKIKPQLATANLDTFESIISYDKLIKLLDNNQPASELAARINDRKLNYSDFQDNISLISSLSTTGWKNVNLTKTATDIQNDILLILSSNNGTKSVTVSESEVVKTQTIQTNSQVEELQYKLNQLQQQYENLKNDTKIIEYQSSFSKFKKIIYIVIALFVVLFVLMIFFLLKRTSKEGLREDIIENVLRSQRIAEKFKIQSNTSYILSERDKNEIIERISKQNQVVKPKEIIEKPSNESLEKVNTPTKYLKGNSGKIFNRIESTPENSFFKIFNESGNTAQFEFDGNEAKAIAQRIFNEDICQIVSGSYQNAHSVITSKPGKIIRIGDQWEVIEPIEIKLV
jgi:hypothetical protein